MIYVNNKSVINDDSFLIFEFKIDDHISVDFIKNELNYKQIKDKSRNTFINTYDGFQLKYPIYSSMSNDLV